MKHFVFANYDDTCDICYISEKTLETIDQDFRKATGRSLFDDDVEIIDHSNVQSVLVSDDEVVKLKALMDWDCYTAIADLEDYD